MEYKTIAVNDLKPCSIRDIRNNIVERLNERIKKSGFNPAHPLTVMQNGDGYYVLDGNHRLKALDENNISEVPCIVYKKEIDGYKVAVECNRDEDTYAPMDVFDWLSIIHTQKKQGKTQAEIGRSMGWSQQQVGYYVNIANKITTDVLEKFKNHQKGRVVENTTSVVNFTEGWFRASGLYNVSKKYQEYFFERFVNDGMNWSSTKVKSECSKYVKWQEYYKIAEEKLSNKDDLDTILEMIETGVFTTEQQLIDKIESVNKKAKNKILCGDSRVILDEIEDNSIDLVITDPPYGMKYVSKHSKYSDSVTKNGIINDDDSALGILNDVFLKLQNKTKNDAGFYVFCSWKTYPDFKNIIEQYADIKNLIIWDKGNHGAGDLNNTWGNRYECIIYATRGKRRLNKRMQDIISIPRVNSSIAIHSTQKPIELIKRLLVASSRKYDVVCDPFMGSGSTIKAVKQCSDVNYIGIEIDDTLFEKGKAWIGDD